MTFNEENRIARRGVARGGSPWPLIVERGGPTRMVGREPKRAGTTGKSKARGRGAVRRAPLATPSCWGVITYKTSHTNTGVYRGGQALVHLPDILQTQLTGLDQRRTVTTSLFVPLHFGQFDAADLPQDCGGRGVFGALASPAPLVSSPVSYENADADLAQTNSLVRCVRLSSDPSVAEDKVVADGTGVRLHSRDTVFRVRHRTAVRVSVVGGSAPEDSPVCSVLEHVSFACARLPRACDLVDSPARLPSGLTEDSEL
jgi:hypothetical protein